MRKEYTITNQACMLYETIQRALKVLWGDRFIIYHVSMKKKINKKWIVKSFVQVNFQNEHTHGWSGLDVALVIPEEVAQPTGEDTIHIMVTNNAVSLPPISVEKKCYDPQKPLQAWGRMFVDKNSVHLLIPLEKLVSN